MFRYLRFRQVVRVVGSAGDPSAVTSGATLKYDPLWPGRGGSHRRTIIMGPPNGHSYGGAAAATDGAVSPTDYMIRK